MLDLSDVLCSIVLYTISVYNSAIQAIHILGKPYLFYGIRNMNKMESVIKYT